MTPMNGKVILLTGATSGIGQVAAESLAGMGAQIIQIARDPARGQAGRSLALRLSVPRRHTLYIMQTSHLMREAKRVAAEIAHAHPRIDVLMNNAGAMFGARSLTDEGLERTFAPNHMSYFVLTACLRDFLVSSAPARIINTASDAHQMGRIDFADLQSVAAYRGSFLETLR